MTSPELVLTMLPGSKPFTRRAISLKTATIVGRISELQEKSVGNAFFDSCVISRTHGIFYYRGGKFYYKDTNSRNGSWINSEKINADEEKVLKNGDNIKLGQDVVDCGEMQKIFAKILLTHPNVEDSLIPSSLDPMEASLDRTGSWDDLLQLFESNKVKTEYEKTSIKKLELARVKAKELGISKAEALQLVGY